MILMRTLVARYSQVHLHGHLSPAARNDVVVSPLQQGRASLGLRFLSAHLSHSSSSNSTNMAEPPPSPRTPRPDRSSKKTYLPSWANWLLGSVLTLAASFWSTQWKKILLIEGEIETAVKMAETVADVVEKAASAVEQVSEEVAGKLPEEGKLKKLAKLVEHASKETVEEMETAKDIIHKVDDLKHEVETFLDPISELVKHVDGSDKFRRNM